MAHGETECVNVCDVEFDGPLTPFGAKDSYKPIFLIDEARLCWCGKMFFGLVMGCVLRAGRGYAGELLIAYCEDLDSPVYLRCSLQTVQAPGMLHKKDSCCSDLLQPRVANHLLLGNPEQDEDGAEEALFEE